MAKTPAHQSWFRIALHDPKANDTTLVAAAGEHLGAAIAAAEHHAAKGAYAVAALDADESDIPLGEAVGKQPVVALGRPREPVPTFAWPIGILPALGPELGQLASAQRGYMQEHATNPFVLEAQVARGELVEVMMSLVERLPAADNLEVTLMPHFEGAKSPDIWNTSRVNAKKILAFLDDHDDELFGNGFLELGVYLRAQKATLRLTEHKTIAWVAADASARADVERWFAELNIPPVARLVHAMHVPHFHYRPAKSRDRAKLCEELYRQRLRRVPKIATGAREPS